MHRETARPLRSLLWQGLWRPGAEWCELQWTEDGWRIAGLALTAVDGTPERVSYEVVLDTNWVTRHVRIEAQSGTARYARALRLDVSEDQKWRVERDPKPVPEQPRDDLGMVRGLFDVDLGFSPSTNTLPIRRAAPAIGDSIDVSAVWVRFPELTIEPLPQRYTRLGERRYRYESAGGAFVAELEVDDLGLIVTYENGWQRIAESSWAGL